MGSRPQALPSRASLERAMENDELLLYYQPKVCLLRGEIIGGEALVRWNDPARSPASSIVSPDDFLPLAERSGLLHDITIKLLDQAVAACVRLRAVRAGLAVSMNVAPDDLESQLISDRISELLTLGTITCDDLQIEITESAVMGNVDRVNVDLERLTGLGIKVLMDDFGTGYSSIDRLSQLPFTSLKLDQGIVQRMGTSKQNLNTVRSAISMARELRMTSVAEGIESVGAYNFLIASGCEEAQGYYIARPMSLDDFESFVRAPHDFEGSQIGRVHQTVFNLIHMRKSLIDAAFCIRLGPASVLPSVIAPELSVAPETSRVGLWYYGIGQRLLGHATFRAIESPFLEMHRAARVCLELVIDGVADVRLDRAVELIDRLTDRLIELLHALERELLASRRPA